MMQTAVIMTEQDYKQRILEMIEAFERDGHLGYIYGILLEAEAEVKGDMGYKLTPEQISRVEESIENYKAGNVHSHEEVIEEMKQWDTE